MTGGRPTTIDGTLRCTIAGADVYLINRAGVTFGPNASLDVDGSLAVTTADVVRLADGGTFSAGAGSPAGDLLTSAAPVAFGFLTPSRTGTVALNRPVPRHPARQRNRHRWRRDRGRRRLRAAPGGKVEMAAVASTAELSVDMEDLNAGVGVSDGDALGPVGLTFFSIDVTGSPAGCVDVVAHDLTLNGSNVTADSFGDAAGGTLKLRATNAMSIASSRLSATAFGTGKGAAIALDAASVISPAGPRCSRPRPASAPAAMSQFERDRYAFPATRRPPP